MYLFHHALLLRALHSGGGHREEGVPWRTQGSMRNKEFSAQNSWNLHERGIYSYSNAEVNASTACPLPVFILDGHHYAMPSRIYEHGAISRRWVCHYASVSLQTAIRYGGGMKMWLFQVPVLYAHTWHMPLFSSTTAVAPNLNVYNAFIHIYSTDLALYCWCKISYLCVF